MEKKTSGRATASRLGRAQFAHRQFKRCFAAYCLLIAAAARGADVSLDQVTVGVLEEVPGVSLNEPSHYAVRAVFQEIGGTWQTLPNFCGAEECLTSITSSYPPRTEWTISFQGRQIGTLWARTPASFAYYADIGQQRVEDPSQVPTVGASTVDYSGFQETPVHRPLLTTSGTVRLSIAQANWQPRAPDRADSPRVWAAFRHLAPLIDDCRLDARGEFIPSKGRSPRRRELEIAAAWGNNDGDAILQARIRPSAFANCDGPIEHPSEYWFYRGVKGSLRLLPGQGTDTSTEKAEIDSRARLAMPIDFVNLDGRDVSIFLLAGYDAGGYALYYDNFGKVARFTWLYH